VDGHVRRLAVATSRPTRDPALVRRLFTDRLAALGDYDPGFGLDLIRLSVGSAEPLAPTQPGFGPAQAGFGPAQAGAPDRTPGFALLIDQLGARFGPGSALWLVPQNRHRPECAVAALSAHREAPEPPGLAPALDQDSLGPIRPIRLLERPEPVETLAEVPDGPPLRFRWRRVLHEVACAEGPERIASEWWQESGGAVLTRDYFRVETRQGVRVWLYREGLYDEVTHPRWFVHGLFA
jgi:protein ImuB